MVDIFYLVGGFLNGFGLVFTVKYEAWSSKIQNTMHKMQKSFVSGVFIPGCKRR